MNKTLDYKVALFDMDGVALIDEGYFTDKLKAQGKLSPNAGTDSFFEGAFQECLSGKADLKEELAKVINKWGWQGTVDQLIAFWFSVGDDLNAEAATYIERLKEKGVACYMASDQEKYRGEYLKGKFNHLFEGFFISNEIGHKKKEPEFFEFVYKKVKDRVESKSEILFVDDGESNVANARAFGIDAVHYRSPDDLPSPPDNPPSSIGLKRGTVKLVQHSQEWERLFRQEKELLEGVFGVTIVSIEHIGSTAIPGIVAKPIIDMNIGVDSLKTALEMKEKLEKLGYEHRPFKPNETKEDLKEQELYVKGAEKRRTHHAHVTVFNSEYWKKDLLFRDYLRANQIVAQEYSRLKEKLASQYAEDRYTYTDKKKDFIEKVLKKAKGKESRIASQTSEIEF